MNLFPGQLIRCSLFGQIGEVQTLIRKIWNISSVIISYSHEAPQLSLCGRDKCISDFFDFFSSWVAIESFPNLCPM